MVTTAVKRFETGRRTTSSRKMFELNLTIDQLFRLRLLASIAGLFLLVLVLVMASMHLDVSSRLTPFEGGMGVAGFCLLAFFPIEM